MVSAHQQAGVFQQEQSTEPGGAGADHARHQAGRDSGGDRDGTDRVSLHKPHLGLGHVLVSRTGVTCVGSGFTEV